MAPMILMNVDYFIKQFGYFGSKRYYPNKHYTYLMLNSVDDNGQELKWQENTK